MINIKTNLLKNLTAAFVIVFTVGVSDVKAQDIKNSSPNISKYIWPTNGSIIQNFKKLEMKKI